MEASFVSRARTAINSAAAKAEKVLTDINKSDSHSVATRDLDKQSPKASASESPKEVGESKDLHGAAGKKAPHGPLKIKEEWHDRFRKLRLGKKGIEKPGKPQNSGMAYAIFDENLYMMGESEFSNSKDSEDGGTTLGSRSEVDIIPSSVILKNLAVAITAGLNYNSIKEVQVASKGSSPIRDRGSVSFSAMKSLVLREKEDKQSNEFGADEKVMSLINALVNAEGHFTNENISGLETKINATSLIKDIHGAPVESFVVRLSEAVGRQKTLHKMASLWYKVVAEIRRLWWEGQYIPGIPPDDKPDLNSCLLHQQMQVINCCISRKRRYTAAVESLESVAANACSHRDTSSASDKALAHIPYFYAKAKSGELVVRLGADKMSENLTMLETGDPVYSPILQEPPLLTEDVIKETEEFVLRTGSVGAGCSQLLSDMQAFKAANPGCILEDFVRWHSPPDWTESETISDLDDTSDSDLCLSKGQLSSRMQKEGNLWRELWETSKPVPAVRQSPLYDEDLAVDGILEFLEEIPLSELLKQLFVCALASGLAIAEASVSKGNSSLSDMLGECKKYIVATFQSSKSWVDKLDEICQVYETVEMMVINQDEAGNISMQSSRDDLTKNGFKKLSSIFRGKNDNSLLSSIFSKKPPKPSSSSSE